MTDLQTLDLDELRAEAARQGVNLTTSHEQEKIHGLRTGAAQRAAADARREAQDAEQDRTWQEKAAAGLNWLGDFITLLLIQAISAVLLPLGILGLAYAEIQRVRAGIAVFEPVYAGTLAVVVIAMYLVLLVVRAHLETVSSGSTAKTVGSLRLVWRGLLYRVGVGVDGRKWEARKQTRVQQAQGAARVGFGVVMLLGTMGSMQDEIARIGGNWIDAIYQVITGASLSEAATYAGGVGLTFALLTATHWAVSYAYEQFARIRPEVVRNENTTQQRTAAAADDAERLYLITKIEKKRTKADPTPPPHPAPALPMFPDTSQVIGSGNGRGGHGHGRG